MWVGELTPCETAYRVTIVYYNRTPRVHVVDPDILPDAPYRNADGSLGLYYPPDGSWTPKKLIANTIVPWACLWLYFYEVWVTTGTWYGEGVSAEQHRENMRIKE